MSDEPKDVDPSTGPRRKTFEPISDLDDDLGGAGAEMPPSEAEAEAVSRRVSEIMNEITPEESGEGASDGVVEDTPVEESELEGLDSRVSAILDELAPDESEMAAIGMDSRVAAILDELAPDESASQDSDIDSRVAAILDGVAAEEVARTAPYLPEAPIRDSLSDEQIMMRFRESSDGSTEAMMQALEKQVALREEEEEAFESWSQMARNLRGDEAEPHIARQRIIFDGGDPGPEEEFLEKFNQELLEAAQSKQEENLGPEERNSSEEQFSEVSEDDFEAEAEEHDSSSRSAEGRKPAGLPSRQKSRRRAAGSTSSLPSNGGLKPSSAVLSWFGIGLPAGAVIAGGYFVYSGLTVLESVSVLGLVSLFVGVFVGLISHLGVRKGRATGALIVGIFGRYGAVLPGIILFISYLFGVSFLIWWAADLLHSIAGVAGFWPYESWIGQSGAAILIVALVALFSLTSQRLLRVMILASSTSAILGLIMFSARAIPALEPSLDWSGPFDWMNAVSVGSVTLALAALVTLFLAADLSTLSSESNSGASGFLSAVTLILPFSLLVFLTVWWSANSFFVGRRLVTSPVELLVEGAPNFYPTFAIIGLVVPVVGLASLLSYSLVKFVPTLRIPGSFRIHRVVVIVLILGSVVALLASQVNLKPLVPELALTIGVFVVAVAAALFVSGPGSSSKGARKLGWFRSWTALAVFGGTALGLGFLDSDVPWLSWQGFLFPAIESLGVQDLSRAQPGLLISFTVAALVAALGEIIESVRNGKHLDVKAS